MPAISRPPNRLLQDLPTVEFLSLHPHLETVELANEAVLAEAGAPVQQVYLPHSGAVAMMVSPSRGQTVEVAMVGRDSVVGAAAALDAGPSLTDAIVVAPGTASVLKAEDLRVAAGRSSTLRNLLARHEQALSARAQQSAACNASHSVEARLSRLLLRARSVRQRRIAADPGIPGANDRRAAQRGFDRGACVSAGRPRQLQPGTYRNYGYRRPAENVL
jgi:CRP-like cAMP-binding protein